MGNVKESWDKLISKLDSVIQRGSEHRGRYPEIFHLISEIPNLILYDDPERNKVDLVHYTTWNCTMDMFKKIQNEDLMDGQKQPFLRMYNYEQSNDPNEGRIKPREWEHIEAELRTFVGDLRLDDYWLENFMQGLGTFGCSFSSGSSGVEDDLTYWRLYGNDGQGCSLKISRQQSWHTYKVRYRDKNCDDRNSVEQEEDLEVAERLEQLFEMCKIIVDNAPEKHKHAIGTTVIKGLYRIIYSYYHLIKDIAFKGENEWRMIRVMPNRSNIRYDTASGDMIKRYIEGPSFCELLSSASVITIGPTVPNHAAARAYIEHQANEVHKIPYVKVKNSKCTYRQGIFQNIS